MARFHISVIVGVLCFSAQAYANLCGDLFDSTEERTIFLLQANSVLNAKSSSPSELGDLANDILFLLNERPVDRLSGRFPPSMTMPLVDSIGLLNRIVARPAVDDAAIGAILLKSEDLRNAAEDLGANDAKPKVTGLIENILVAAERLGPNDGFYFYGQAIRQLRNFLADPVDLFQRGIKYINFQGMAQRALRIEVGDLISDLKLRPEKIGELLQTIQRTAERQQAPIQRGFVEEIKNGKLIPNEEAFLIAIVESHKKYDQSPAAKFRMIDTILDCLMTRAIGGSPVNNSANVLKAIADSYDLLDPAFHAQNLEFQKAVQYFR